jgi:adenosylcobinamide-phosphate synthase
MTDAAVWGWAVLVALALDLLFGEPRRLHPVVGIGRLLRALERALNKGSVRQRRTRGTLAWLIATAVVGLAAAAVAAALAVIEDRATRALLLGVALKPALSIRALVGAGRAVLRPLQAGDLAAARQALSRHLVSRDTYELPADEVAGAAVASLAENLVDSVLAPLLWFAVAGLPGAWLWRTINTADAMWGYRNDRFEHFGRTAARADDLGAWPAARLGGLAVSVAAITRGRRISPRRLAAEAARTPSPNGGWPMGAAALALGIRLEKRGSYVLNESGRAPGATDLSVAIRATWLLSLGLGLAMAGLAAALR